ncbi:hypothetical protein U9M48_015671 [Paspalum notatum var. saurae]|uniref:EF-hand domain-containing protein n=1 Tax=Paspalum notatum var. saurae TaxID=547442 RepID=A0AAQ3T718_PASNO
MDSALHNLVRDILLDSRSPASSDDMVVLRSAPPSPRRPRSPPASESELLLCNAYAEMLLRLPPEEPKLMYQFACVCAAWRRILTDGSFFLRHRRHHRFPPTLGYLYNDGLAAHFVPTSARSIHPRLPEDGHQLFAVDSHHGRAVFQVIRTSKYPVLVWDVLADSYQELPLPTASFPLLILNWTAAVLCGNRTCDHLSCYGGPFRVAMVGVDFHGSASAFTFSSQAGGWSAAADAVLDDEDCAVQEQATIIGDSVLFRTDMHRVARYDLQAQQLTFLERPAAIGAVLPLPRGTALIPAPEDGRIRLAGLYNDVVLLWERLISGPPSAAEWQAVAIVDLKTTISAPTGTFTDETSLIGFTESPKALFLNVSHRDGGAVLRFEIDTGLWRILPGPGARDKEKKPIIPFSTFYSPAMRMFLLDGATLLAFVADEPAFARSVDVCFAALDSDGDGELSGGDLRRALNAFRIHDGAGFGSMDAPPRLPSELAALYRDVFAVYDRFHAGHDCSLDRANFRDEIRHLMLAVADRLASEPIRVALDPPFKNYLDGGLDSV